jgi:hypothetical protein
MGHILDLPAEASPYGAEVRSESFYLTSPQRFRPVTGGVALPVADRKQILAALARVAGHPSARVEPAAAKVEVRREGDWLIVAGGNWLHVYAAEQERTGVVEATYSHLEAFLRALDS